MLGFFSFFFWSSADFSQTFSFLKSSFLNTIRMSNSLDPDQVRRIAGPGLGLNRLQRLSTDDSSRQRVSDESKKILIVSCFQLTRGI